MNNDLTITEEMVTMPLAGKTEAGSAEVQPARDSRLGVTDYRTGGRFQIGRPAHFLETVIQNSLMPKKTSTVRCPVDWPKASYSLNCKGKMSISR